MASFAYQTSDQANFAPTWDTSKLSSSLIYQQSPPADGYDPLGDFNDPDTNPGSHNLAGGLPVLTDGSYGKFQNNGPHPAFATCGPTAGQYVIYTLGSSANGYDVTNIQVAGGWNDNGRDSQFYTLSYSTVANPTLFIPLVQVTNNPGLNPFYAAGNLTQIRAAFTSASGLLASNVYAIYVDFTAPPGVPNGYSGYSEISVFGSPSASDTIPIAVTSSNQNTASPTWTVETPNLIAGQLPNSVGPGAYAGNFNNEASTEGLPALTDGTLGPFGVGETNFATCGGAFGAGSSVTYTSTNGWNLTNIVVYSGWGNYNRGGQFYKITYSTLQAPATFIPLVSVSYNPPFSPPANYNGFNNLAFPAGASANRVQIAPANGAATFVTNAYAVKFDFTPQTGNLDNGYSGYSEIVLQGSSLAPIVLPTITKPVFSGTNLIVTGAGGTPNIGYSWLTATNLLTPLSNWTVIASGTLNGAGSFSNSLPVNPSQAAGFFRLWMP